MFATLLTLSLALAVPTSTLAASPTPVALATAIADTDSIPRRVVKRFPPIEVHALLPDLRSSQTVHLLPSTALHAYPIDNLADVVALQAGVVAQAEELHVRGGRSGETVVELDGIRLDEPQRHRTLEVPLLALRGAELVSGTPDAQYGGGLSGVLALRTLDPGPRPSAEWRWQSDGRSGTHYDRVGARASAPLPLLGLGAVAASDVTLDDTSLPMLRTVRRHELAGLSLGWRAENRLLGSLKLAPIEQPDRFSAQVFVSRQVHEPYSPNWSLDGWTYIDPNPKVSPIFSPVELPGYLRYRAADHLAITDERTLATLLSTTARRGPASGTLTLGWLRTRSVTSVGGGYRGGIDFRPTYGNSNDRSLFYVLWGDYPLYRESASDVVTLRADGELVNRRGTRFTAGAGVHHDQVRLRETDFLPSGRFGADVFGPQPFDSIRAYRAGAPGAFGYVQTRWASGGMILNAGLRAEYFTAGSERDRQTLPGRGGVWSLAPRLGIAYPISVRDVFSFAYVRIQQDPARDYLYDQRTAITNRQPLGDPALVPATVVSYEAAVKHVFGPEWALQSSVFFRDVFDQVGARDFTIADGPFDLRYANEDESAAVGFEWSLVHASGEHRRLEAHYTWMQARGNESRAEGDPYGTVRQARTPSTGDPPVSWDRRHSLALIGAWQWRERWSFAWSTAVGSPLPWTPKQVRQQVADLGLTNSGRLGWTEATNASLQWTPPRAYGFTLGIEARNLFDERGDRVATLDGYPNPLINTIYDDYGAYRTATGQGGGAFWSTLPAGDPGHWVPVHDARLGTPPRELRASIGARW